MKLALVLLALSSTAFSQIPTPQPAPAQTPTPAPAQTPTPGSTPSGNPAQTAAPTQPTAPKPASPPIATVITPQAPPPMPKPEDHNGPAYKNSKSTLPKVAGLPHVLYSLKYIDTKVGTGPLAEPRKYYTVNYTGWFTDGTKFDSSFDHTPKEPITFPYGAQRVIIGWDTGFEGMRVGGKRRLYVPYQLAYGLLGRPPKMGPKANLIFDVELVAQSDKPPTPPARPGQPAAAPGARQGLPGGTFRPAPAPATPAAPAAPGTVTPPPAPPTPPATPAPTTPPATTAPTTAPAAPATPPAPAKPPTQ